MKRTKLAATVLVVGLLSCLIYAGATAGSSDDPLVTLSYLTDVFQPQILATLEGKLSAQESDLAEQVAGKITQYNQTAASGTETDLSTAVYTVVELKSGQTLYAEIGCELLLRVGSGTAVADSSVALVDMTGGSTIENGQSLVSNHLYLATIDGRGFYATSDVKLLVRGEYRIS